MPGIDPLKKPMSRRTALKIGARGMCALGLGMLQGCAPVPPEEALEANRIDTGGVQKGLLGIEPSPWFTGLSGGRVRCELCPKACLLNSEERGSCRVRENRQGKLYTLAYGNPALVQEDPVERKPFFHVLPGSRALSLATAGCNLSCHFCEVWDMALVDPEELYAYELSPQQAVDQAKAGRVAAISYAFGEPVAFYEYMTAVARLAREAGLLNLVHTAGYIKKEPLEELAGWIDAVNVDLKGFDPAFYREYVGGELDPVLECLKTLRRSGVHLEITTIVIPTLNDDPVLIREMCHWIASELGVNIPLHLARFYPLYRLSALPRTPAESLERARNAAMEAGLQYVYLSRLSGHEAENTFCPQCGEKVVARVGFMVRTVEVEEGSCRFCGAELPGIWA